MIMAAGRRVSLKGGGERKPLNASLPTQLVIDFNAAASSQGHGLRDALLQEVLLTFLAKTHPDSKSVQQLLPAATRSASGKLSNPEALLMLSREREREALRISRDCAQKILDVTADTERRPPKPSPRGVGRQKKKAS